MRFWGNLTQAEIGGRLGISQMHESRLLSRALDHLKDRLTEEPAGTWERSMRHRAEREV